MKINLLRASFTLEPVLVGWFRSSGGEREFLKFIWTEIFESQKKWLGLSGHIFAIIIYIRSRPVTKNHFSRKSAKLFRANFVF